MAYARASLATLGTGFFSTARRIGMRVGSPARLYIEAAVAGTGSPTVTNRDRRVEPRGPFPQVR